MRFALPIMLFLATFAPAAPVPSTAAAEQKRLEALWKELDAPDLVSRVRAAFRFLDEPNAVAFLKERLPPVEASKEQITRWLKELDSDDEKVWQAAYEQLEYFPPRLQLTPAEQAEFVTTNRGRRLLFALWCKLLISFEATTEYEVELTPPADGGRRAAKITFVTWVNGKRQTFSQDGQVSPLEFEYGTRWGRVELAARVLHRINTKESREVLEQLASGDHEVRPTRWAVRLLKAKAGDEDKSSFADLWSELPFADNPKRFDAVSALTRAPDAARVLKEKLPAIKASKEQMTEWLKALDDEDPKVWRPAFGKMLYFRPRIALDWQEQIDAVSTAHGRTALFGLWRGYSETPASLNADPDTAIGIEEKEGTKRLVLSVPGLNGKRDISRVDLDSLDQMSSDHWQRARLAIIALELIKTGDAKAALKQLADGHPDILPTKEAKAALERLK